LKSKGKVAFVKFGGLSAGGTERWLHTMAVLMQQRGFTVDFYYCDSAPYIGSSFVHPDTDPHRMKFLKEHGIQLIKFNVGFKDVTIPTHDWVDTDFWEVFDQTKYDLVQTAKAGPAEYPYHLMEIPVIEYVTLAAGVDHSSSIAWSIHISQWQRKLWMSGGGNVSRSSVIPVIPDKPITDQNLRKVLSIPAGAFVAGLHQRDSAEIYSDWPLNAFQHLPKDAHFILLGGSEKYVDQAKRLGIINFHRIPHSADPQIISSFLNSLDIYLHGRKDGETFGNVLAEALLHGIPCISHYSASGANAQVETIGPGGRFLKSRSEYKETLLQMYGNSATRKHLGELGNKHAEKYFNSEHAGASLEQVYLRIITGQSSFPNVSRTPLPYALSHLGYLVAGDLEDKDAIESHAIFGGYPEKFDVKISNFLNKKLGIVYFDIGANSGLYSAEIAFHNPSAQVFAFEPEPNNIEKIDATSSLNGWAHRFQVFHQEFSDNPDAAELSLSGSSSTFDVVGDAIRSKNRMLSKIDTLDNFVNNNEIRKIDFIKVRTRGNELKVLLGARTTIKSLRPILFVEVDHTIHDPENDNSNFENVISFSSQENYVVLRSDGRGLLFLHRRKPKTSRIPMYLFLPREVALPLIAKLFVFIVVFHLSRFFSEMRSFFDFVFEKFLQLYHLLKSGNFFSKSRLISIYKVRKS
jgi:FkbM family methyltransferase